MSDRKTGNRFENNRKAVLAVVYSMIGLTLLILCFFAVKIVRDEMHRGFERTLVMREPRPASDLSQKPPRDLMKIADGLEDKDYRLRVDENGYIKPSAVHEKADASIVFLGGSTTECQFMSEEDRFPYLVGRKLDTILGRPVNTFNSGHAGNNSLHCLLLLQGKVLPQKPTMAVFMECINDVTMLMVLGDYWSPSASRGVLLDKEYNPLRTLIIRHLVGRRVDGGSADDEFAGSRGKGKPRSPEELTRLFRMNLEHFVFLCRQHDIVPVLMTQFNRFSDELSPNLSAQMAKVFTDWGISYPEYRQRYDAMNDTIRQVAREQGVLLVDLDRQVPKVKDYMYDVVHLNAAGSHMVADIVATALEPALRQRLNTPAGAKSGGAKQPME